MSTSLRGMISLVLTVLLGAGCAKSSAVPLTTASTSSTQTQTDRQTNPQTSSNTQLVTSFSEPRLGLSFNYPSSWGKATFHEEAGAEFVGKNLQPKGKTFRITWEKIPEMYACGSSLDYTFPRGAYECDMKHGFDLTARGYIYSFMKTLVNPFKTYQVPGGTVVVINEQSFSPQDLEAINSSPGSSSIPHESHVFVLLNLKGRQYQGVLWNIDTANIPYAEVEKVLKSIQIW